MEGPVPLDRILGPRDRQNMVLSQSWGSFLLALLVLRASWESFLLVFPHNSGPLGVLLVRFAYFLMPFWSWGLFFLVFRCCSKLLCSILNAFGATRGTPGLDFDGLLICCRNHAER